MDPISSVLITFGVILIVAGWIQLLFSSFGSDFNWGLATLFVPPLSYIYGFFALDKAKDALIFSGIGWVLVLAGL
jgi:uncharacterized membrane protein